MGGDGTIIDALKEDKQCREICVDGVRVWLLTAVPDPQIRRIVLFASCSPRQLRQCAKKLVDDKAGYLTRRVFNSGIIARQRLEPSIGEQRRHLEGNFYAKWPRPLEKRV